MACCGLTVAMGAVISYDEAQKARAAIPVDDFDGGVDPSDLLPDDQTAADDPADEPAAALPPIAVADLPADWDEAKDQVAVSVRDRIEVENSTLRGHAAVCRRLTEDLCEVLLFEGAKPAPLLTQDDLDGWNKSADDAFEFARSRLSSASMKAFSRPSPGVYESAFADGNDIARAVLFETIRKLKVKGEPLLFMPEVSHLIVVGSQDKRGLEAAAALVEQRLQLPNAQTGRGWKLGREGLEPWAPPATSRFALLRLQALAHDANLQKAVLEQQFKQEGRDTFVGTTLLTDSDDGETHTYAVWTKGAETLMPKAEMIVFVDLDQPEADRVVAAGLWADIAPKLSKKMVPETTYWPLRYRLEGFPDKKALKSFGLHRLFREGAP
jgi:hypothetical protein